MLDLGFEAVPGTACQLGESPVYDDRRDALFFCDIPAGRVLCLSLGAGTLRSWSFGTEVGALGLAESGRLVMALRDSVILFDPDAGDHQTVAAVESERPHMRLNDGKVGPDGCFWVGSIDDTPERRPLGTLFRVTPGGAVEAKVSGLRTSNGLAFGPDGSVLYHSDPRGLWIDAWRLEPSTGTISDRRRLATLEPGEGRPDGAAVDAEGSYWSAGIGGGRLNRFGPDGGLMAAYRFPVANPTMPCFGGPGLRTLFVTSLRKSDPAAGPDDGALFRAPGPVAGTPVHRFRDVTGRG